MTTTVQQLVDALSTYPADGTVCMRGMSWDEDNVHLEVNGVLVWDLDFGSMNREPVHLASAEHVQRAAKVFDLDAMAGQGGDPLPRV